MTRVALVILLVLLWHLGTRSPAPPSPPPQALRGPLAWAQKHPWLTAFVLLAALDHGWDHPEHHERPHDHDCDRGCDHDRS
jgi:hypothetical protein